MYILFNYHGQVLTESGWSNRIERAKMIPTSAVALTAEGLGATIAMAHFSDDTRRIDLYDNANHEQVVSLSRQRVGTTSDWVLSDFGPVQVSWSGGNVSVGAAKRLADLLVLAPKVGAIL